MPPRFVIRLVVPLLIAFFTGISVSAEPVTVKVGEYNFEPFVEGDLGITPAFLTILNGYQNQYRFEFVRVPARRRYGMLQSRQIDAVFFEMPVWGWESLSDSIEVTPPLLRGEELYVTQADNPLGDAVFALTPERQVALAQGYHYAFADFDANPSAIGQLVDPQFLSRQKHILDYVRQGRVDVGLMSNIFLRWEIKRQPELASELRVAPKIDHEYRLPIILRAGGPISSEEMTSLLSRMLDDGTLKSFFGSFGLVDLVIFDPGERDRTGGTEP